jgi:hypothetical protein
MQTPMKILLAAGLGAASMYYMDPTRGQKRRRLARARIEYGKDAVSHGVQSATEGFNTASRHARAAGHQVSRRSGKLWKGARSLGHDLGERMDQVSHGASDAGNEVRNRAAGAAATVGSFFNRHRPNGHALAEMRDEPRGKLKFMLIPVTWIFTVGMGAAAMYYFDSSQGIYRRTRLRDRFEGWRNKTKEKLGSVGRDISDKAGEIAEQPKAGNSFGEHLRPQARPQQS